MSSAGEIAAAIEAKGQEIRTLKSEGTAKDALKPHIDQLLILKAKYKTTTGADYKPPGSEVTGEKKPTVAAASAGEATDPDKKSKKQLNREKKEAEKALAKALAKQERERKLAEAGEETGGVTQERCVLMYVRSVNREVARRWRSDGHVDCV